MKLVANKSFKKAFKRLSRKNPQLKNKVLSILDILENNPFTPALKSHKLKGNLSQYWSCSINLDLSAIKRFCQGNNIKKLSLFSSVLRDDFTSLSDVDILVEFE